MRRVPVASVTLSQSSPDQRQDDVAVTDRLFDALDEVLAGGDRVHVHEHAALAEARLERVREPPGVGGAVLAPVVDEDARHRK